MQFLQITSLMLSSLGIATATSCKCVPTDDCWPLEADWSSFNASISGRLIKTVPPASVCYPELSNYNATACDLVLEGWLTSEVHSSDPASLHDPAWANSSCNPIYPNGTSVLGDPDAGEKGCSLGLYPEYVVNATDASDVQSAFAFATTWNLRMTIKNTGHGSKSTAYGGLSIWTHNLKSLHFHSDWTPQGNGTSLNGTTANRLAITVGAGVQDGELFDFASEHNVLTVGGTSLDVGVVGWSAGGGHGLMTGAYGMGADNILEATIATPDGQVLVANELQNQDLFWAIRGGGGGTFGAILNQTMAAYPSVGIVALGLDIAATANASSSSWWSVIAEFLSLMPYMKERGVHGYYSIGGPPSSSTLSLGGTLAMFNGTIDELQNITASFQELLANAQNAGTIVYSSQTLEFDGLTELFDLLLPSDSAGATAASASRLITRDAVQNVTHLAEVLDEIGPRATAPSDGWPNYSMSGTLTASWTPVDSSLNPAWRSTVVHMIVTLDYDDSFSRELKAAMNNDITHKKLLALRQLAPNSGAYFNEANQNEPGWQWDFFGKHYDRLYEIKQKYDPNSVLWCRQCVGSEDWSDNEDGSLCLQFRPWYH